MEIQEMTDAYAKELCKPDSIVVRFRSTKNGKILKDKDGDEIMVNVVENFFKNLLILKNDLDKVLKLYDELVAEAYYEEQWYPCETIGISPSFAVLKVQMD